MNEAKAIQEFDVLRTTLREKQQKQYATPGLVTVGDFTYGIPRICSWNEETTLEIGKFCSIASGVTILLGGNHRVDWNSTYPFNALMPSFTDIKGHPASKGNVKIGNDVWIGSDVKIMSGVTIADGCVISANAVVTKDVPKPYTIVGGVPAKLIKQRFSETITARLCEMQWWNWADKDIVAVIPLLQSNNINGLWQYYQDHLSN